MESRNEVRGRGLYRQAERLVDEAGGAGKISRLRSLSGFRAEMGREYHIQTGIVGNTCFLAVDGEIVVTMSDPDPINDPNCGRVGLGVYYSWVEFRKFRLYRAVVHPVAREYTANF